ncbi:MAG: hypothetical protein MJZ34_11680 [Paludibacteraceae bacterium]|nr:hypothetical protein [Paludibacteraceae bacterium]
MNKHFLLLIILLLSFSCQSSKQKTTEIKSNISASAIIDSAANPSDTLKYEAIYYVREGGGNIAYEIRENTDSLNFQFKKINFKESNLVLNCSKQDFDSTAISLMDSLMKCQLPLKEEMEGTAKRPIMMTGTWVYAYVIKPTGEMDTITLKRGIVALKNIESSIRVQLEKQAEE